MAPAAPAAGVGESRAEVPRWERRSLRGRTRGWRDRRGNRWRRRGGAGRGTTGGGVDRRWSGHGRRIGGPVAPGGGLTERRAPRGAATGAARRWTRRGRGGPPERGGGRFRLGRRHIRRGRARCAPGRASVAPADAASRFSASRCSSSASSSSAAAYVCGRAPPRAQSAAENGTASRTKANARTSTQSPRNVPAPRRC